MTVETDIVDALKALVANGDGTHRVFPDEAPAGTPKPYIIYQHAGGQAVNFLENTPVGKRNARIQIDCWDTTRIGAMALARAVEDALVSSPVLLAEVLHAPVGANADAPQLRGTRQDFSIWFDS